MAKKLEVSPEVLEGFKAATIDGKKLNLPSEMPDKLKRQVSATITKLGGKWDLKARAYVFSKPVAGLIDTLMPKGVAATATKDALADRLVQIAAIVPGMKVLECYSGDGVIVKKLLKAGAYVHGVEKDWPTAFELSSHGLNALSHGDFFEITPHPGFDRVVMNPPAGLVAKYAEHAFKFLKPKGKMITPIGTSLEEVVKRLPPRTVISSVGSDPVVLIITA